MDLTASYAKRWGKRIRKNLKRKGKEPEPWEGFSEARKEREVGGEDIRSCRGFLGMGRDQRCGLKDRLRQKDQP